MERLAVETATRAAPPIVAAVLATPGDPLTTETRAEVEPRFGFDFRRVRVHEDRLAHDSADAVGARAYAVGPHIVMGAGIPAGTERRNLLLHELAHVVQQRGHLDARSAPPRLGAVGDAHEHAADRASHAVARGLAAPALAPRPTAVQRQPLATPPAVAHPENFPTYEQWIATFSNLPTFSARDTPGTHPTGFAVLGSAAASHNATGPTAPPPPDTPQAADHFIDHPLDTWVRANLPDELRTTAYILPADCADIALVLRHVWLFHQQRVERYTSGGRTWTIGAIARETDIARQQRIRSLLVNDVYSGNVGAMVNPYRTAAGTSIRSFAALDPLLHVSDILVWQHHQASATGPRTGGHTQTIETINRDRTAAITGMTLLQGNQPIFAPQSAEIRASGQPSDTDARLRAAPGRRIERANISRGADTTDEAGVWTQRSGSEVTTLEVAGPPRSSTRPAAAAGRPRAFTDWVGRFGGITSVADLQANLETALEEARATIEGGGTISEADLRAVATALGERLWRLARAAHDLGHQSHYEPLYRMRAVIRAFGGNAGRPQPGGPNPHAPAVRAAFAVLDDQFEMAARGATSINFQGGVAAGTRVLRVLVTGFDPFDPGATPTPPTRTRWNPAGAAALELDGTWVPVGPGVVAAVETVVLPVSFAEFAGGGGTEGIVERVVRPLATSVDAVITLSEDPRIDTNQVRIEQFSIGAHELGALTPHRLLPTETVTGQGTIRPIPVAGRDPLGPAIIESNAPVGQIAGDTTDTRHGVNTPAVGPPGTATVPASVTLEFDTPADAQRAATLLNTAPPAAGSRRLELNSAAAVRRVVAATTGRVTGHEERIQLSLADPVTRSVVRFTAGVVEGPGGNFLSNEVAYRTQRLLGRQGARAPLSFHVHTQGAGDSNAPGQTDIRTHTVATLRRIVRAVGLELVRRAPATTAPPTTTGTPRRRP